MSYAQRRQMSSNRTAAIVIVGLIHLVLGYAIITGLAYNVAKKAVEDLKTFDVEDEPPPPEEPPPPPEDTPLPPPPMVSAPPPLVQTQIQTPQIQTTPVIQPPMPPTPVVTPPAPPAPPPAPRITQPKSVVGSLQGLIRNDDYPPNAIENDEQGTVSVVLTIGTNGRVSDCSVSGSSGSRTLDSTTCRILKSRAKFTPAQDSSGNPTTGTFRQSIKWVLQ
ncbi:energy transducer TonB [Sphingomonas sp. HDW15A]|nr:energy transducer TonB [Sphingomonas sp. HDW15A]